jgi:choline dehydrogenase
MGVRGAAPVVLRCGIRPGLRDEWHGNDGPIPITRLRPDELDERSRAFATSATACGHAMCEDHNRPRALGVGPWPRNVRDGLRMSTAVTYLAAARARPTLEIRADTTVDRIEMMHGRASTSMRRSAHAIDPHLQGGGAEHPMVGC